MRSGSTNNPPEYVLIFSSMDQLTSDQRPEPEPLKPKRKRARHPRPLTTRQRKLIRSVSQGVGITRAAKVAGYSSPQSASGSLKLLRERIPSLMDKFGMTERFLMRKCLKPGLLATKTEFFQKDGRVTDERTVIAWGTRHDYLTTALRLRGMLDSGDGSGGPKAMVVIMDWQQPPAPPPTIDAEPESS